MKLKSMALALAGALAIAGAARAQDAPACDSTCLKGFSDQYFAALARNDPSGLPLASNVKFTENGQRMKLGEGFWKAAGQAGYRMEIYDPDTGGVAAETLVAEKGAADPVMYLARLKVEDGKITEVETILARKAESGILWNPDNMKSPPPLFTRSIRPAEQDSRLQLIASADAYWRAMESEGTPDYHPAPFTPDTNRFENGRQTTNVSVQGHPHTAAQQFDEAMFKGAHVYDRRYPVVDVEHGVVLAIVRFGARTPATPAPASAASPAKPAFGPFICEMFAITDGQIREIRAVLRQGTADQPTGW
jgi:hypothetical protein